MVIKTNKHYRFISGDFTDMGGSYPDENCEKCRLADCTFRQGNIRNCKMWREIEKEKTNDKV